MGCSRSFGTACDLLGEPIGDKGTRKRGSLTLKGDGSCEFGRTGGSRSFGAASDLRGEPIGNAGKCKGGSVGRKGVGPWGLGNEGCSGSGGTSRGAAWGGSITRLGKRIGYASLRGATKLGRRIVWTPFVASGKFETIN